MFNINVRSEKPIYIQLIEQIKANMLKGYLKEGDMLPSVRKMAMSLDINPNTVAKAYQELERQGAVVSIRGKGMVINRVVQKDAADMEKATETLKAVIIELKYSGMTMEDIIETVRNICNETGGNI